MSVASKVAEVRYSSKSGVYMPSLRSDKGDLYQEYQGSEQEPTNIVPDFTSLKPTISYVITSSRVSEKIVRPNSVKWLFNDTEIKFDNMGSSNVSTSVFNGETGHFEYIKPEPRVNDYFGLRIIKNLVKATNGAPCTITAIASVAIGNSSDEIRCSYSIPITVGKTNAVKVNIEAGDSKNFNITQKTGPNSSCVLIAIARSGNDKITDNVSYKWYSLQSGKWSELTENTSEKLTVNADMVNTATQFKAEIFQGGSSIGSDVETVTDTSDPLDILLNPTPENETIEEGSEGTVEYRPMLVEFGKTEEYKPTNFFFTFLDSAGNILNTESSQTASKIGVVTEGMCKQASGNVGVVIATEN